jgi:hypothetical protein
VINAVAPNDMVTSNQSQRHAAVAGRRRGVRPHRPQRESLMKVVDVYTGFMADDIAPTAWRS